MELIFRKLDETNKKELLELNELMGQLAEKVNDLEKLKQIVEKYNRREDAFLMVVEDKDNSRICGSMLAMLFDDYCGECKALMVIENVIIHQDYQGKGIGKKMFETIEAWGKRRNVNYGLLVSDMEREGAHNFYRAIGCEEVKGFKKYL